MRISKIVDLLVLSRLKESKIEGIGLDMSAAWARSVGAMEEAAADIGDKISHRSQQAPMTEDFGNSILVSRLDDCRSAVMWTAKLLGSFLVAGMLAWLSSHHVTPGGMWWGFTTFVVVAGGFFGLATTMVLIVQFGDLRTSEASVRKALLKSSAKVWALGDKAIYSASEDDVQVIRIDAIGSVALKGGDVLVRSRFGEPTVTLSGGDMKEDLLKDLVASLKSRIQ